MYGIIPSFNGNFKNNLQPSQLENEELEFKRKISKNKDLLEDIVCFANAKGGVIVVGIDDKLKGENSILK